MSRRHQIAFLFSVAGLCWLSMLAFHELGHVLAALMTGGRVVNVVLHPFAISRTDVMPNPSPLIVVWAGPVLGILIPVGVGLLPGPTATCRNLLRFLAGFCLIANGAYIGLGSLEGIGDAGEMLRHGTPRWCLGLFGAVAICSGLAVWHHLGSLKEFLLRPDPVSAPLAWTLTLFFVAVVALELFLFSAM